MEVGAEMRINFHFLQTVGCHLRLRAVDAEETAKVPLKGTVKTNQVI